MKVLIACEFSGIVREAFAAAGHQAISADLLPSEIPGNHYQGDVLDIIKDGWDLMIGHPPCQFLSYAANHVWNQPGRAAKREKAMQFFMTLYNAPIEKVCIENPFGYPCMKFRKPDQTIQPYYFGENRIKRTCFWLRGLPPLFWSEQDTFWSSRTAARKPKPIYIKNDGKPLFNTEAAKGVGTCRSHERSRFFPKVAQAMAEQWGDS